MTLILNGGTQPENLEVRFGFSPDVEIGDVDLPLKDFLLLASQVLTGTNLMRADPRQAFARVVALLSEESGFNAGRRRLGSRIPFRFEGGQDTEQRFVDVGKGYLLSLRDFLVTAFYVLTNSDLVPDDPRLRFVQHVKLMSVVEANGGKRLASVFDLVFPDSSSPASN